MWGNLAPWQAWKYEQEKQKLLTQRTAKWRLEEQAGVLPGKVVWLINAFDPQPRTLQYKQFLTKTHLEKGLPSQYEDQVVDSVVERVWSQIREVILIEKQDYIGMQATMNSLAIDKEPEPFRKRRQVKQILDVILNAVAYEAPHLLQAQVRFASSPVSYFCSRGQRQCFGLETVSKYVSVSITDTYPSSPV